MNPYGWHLTYINYDIECPHCNRKYRTTDDTEAGALRIYVTKRGYNTHRCECGERFGYCHSMESRVVAFPLTSTHRTTVEGEDA